MMQQPRGAVLLVDDEEFILSSMAMTLTMAGIGEAQRCQDSREAERMLSQREYAAVTLDVNMPFLSGKDLLAIISERFPEVPVIIITGTTDQTEAQEYLELGAFDYLVKPVDKLRLVLTVRHAIGRRQHQAAVRRLQRCLFEHIFGLPETLAALESWEGSPAGVFQFLQSIAASRTPVLVTGAERGLRERVARSLHRLSGASGAFVAAGSLPDSSDPTPCIRQAEAGTLFIDDAGELGLENQAALLRLVRQGRYRPKDSERDLESTARIVVASSRNLEKSARDGEFRRDLFYCLSSSWIPIPPPPAAG